jgi:hypothetical protein
MSPIWDMQSILGHAIGGAMIVRRNERSSSGAEAPFRYGLCQT